MAKTDTSRAKCRTCGRPYQLGDALYAVASKFEWEENVQYLVEFEHAKCHVPFDQALGDLRNRLRDIEDKLR